MLELSCRSRARPRRAGASSSTKRSPSGSSRRRALAADRLGHEEALAPAHAVDRRRMELDELEVGELRRPRACASSMPMPSEPGGFVVRAHSAAAPPVARITARGADRAPVLAGDAAQRPSAIRSAARARARGRDPRLLGDERGQLRARPAARSRCRRHGRRGAASGRPRGRARGCRGGRRRSARRAARGRHARGRLVESTAAAERRTSPRPARSVSTQVTLRVSSAAERRRDAALRPVARRLRQRRRRDQRDARAVARRRTSAA